MISQRRRNTFKDADAVANKPVKETPTPVTEAIAPGKEVVDATQSDNITTTPSRLPTFVLFLALLSFIVGAIAYAVGPRKLAERFYGKNKDKEEGGSRGVYRRIFGEA